MALIMCPECGRDNVSDTAEMCPECGFNIKKYVDEVNRAIEEGKKYEEIFNSIEMPSKPVDVWEMEVIRDKEIRDGKSTCFMGGIFLLGGVFFTLMWGGSFFVLAILFGIFFLYLGYEEIETSKKKYIEYVKEYPKLLDEYKKIKNDFDAYRKKEADKIFEYRKRASEDIRPIDRTIRCPKCGCSSIGVGARGYSVWTGFLGSGKTVNRCGRCGYTWSPKKR